MKILYFNPDRGIPVLGDKGASVHVRAFITAAARLGHEVVLACATIGAGNPPPPARLIELPVQSSDSSLRTEALARGLPMSTLDDPVTRRELARLAHDRSVRRALIARLRHIKFRPDLIYERHALFSRAGFGLAVHFGVPRLLEVNAPLVEEQARFRDLRLVNVAMRAEAASYRKAHAIIAVSEAVAQHAGRVCGTAEHVHVVPNGADLSRYRTSEDGVALRTQLGIGAAPTIGFIGSFKPWHGVDFLFDVFDSLARNHPDARLIAVGDGPNLAALRVRADASDHAQRIILPGRVPHDEIPAWLAAMDVTVAPYHDLQDFYFSPLKIVESLAAGRPVVAPALGQIARLIIPDVTGILYEPGNAAACEAAICALLDQPERRRAMGTAGRQAATAWDWTTIVARALATAPGAVTKMVA